MRKVSEASGTSSILTFQLYRHFRRRARRAENLLEEIMTKNFMTKN